MKKSNPVIFVILFIQTIIHGQGPSVAERYGDRIELQESRLKTPWFFAKF